jgi:hypothetical protein
MNPPHTQNHGSAPENGQIGQIPWVFAIFAMSEEFRRESEKLGRQSEKLKRESEQFGRQSEAFSRESGELGRLSEEFGRTSEELGRTFENFRRVSEELGRAFGKPGQRPKMGGGRPCCLFAASLMVMWPALDAPGGIAKRAGELLAQLQPGAEQAHFNVGLAQVERVGRFPNGQTFHVAQQED